MLKSAFFVIFFISFESQQIDIWNLHEDEWTEEEKAEILSKAPIKDLFRKFSIYLNILGKKYEAEVKKQYTVHDKFRDYLTEQMKIDIESLRKQLDGEMKILELKQEIQVAKEHNNFKEKQNLLIKELIKKIERIDSENSDNSDEALEKRNKKKHALFKEKDEKTHIYLTEMLENLRKISREFENMEDQIQVKMKKYLQEMIEKIKENQRKMESKIIEITAKYKDFESRAETRYATALIGYTRQSCKVMYADKMNILEPAFGVKVKNITRMLTKRLVKFSLLNSRIPELKLLPNLISLLTEYAESGKYLDENDPEFGKHSLRYSLMRQLQRGSDSSRENLPKSDWYDCRGKLTEEESIYYCQEALKLTSLLTYDQRVSILQKMKRPYGFSK